MARTLRFAVVLTLISVVVGFVRRNQVEDPNPSGTASWQPLDATPADATAVSERPPQTANPSASASWVVPVGNSCPPTHPIKAKDASKIYHQPGGLSYERTNPDRCYATPADAEADGYRAAKR